MAVICAFLLFPADSYAAGTTPLTLTLTLRSGSTPISGLTASLCRVAEIKEEPGAIIYVSTTEFAGAGVSFADLSTSKNILLADELDVYASVNNIVRISGVTNEAGNVSFQSLNSGLYLVAQLNGETNEYIFAPFLMSVTETIAAYGVINAYPKTEPQKKPTPSPNPSPNPSPSPSPNPSPNPSPAPSPVPTENPEEKPAEKLPQTGMLQWPIPVLGTLGLLAIVFGVILLFKKGNKRNEK